MAVNEILGITSIKGLISISSLAGGVTVFGVYIPKRIAEKGLVLAGAIMGATSIFTALAFTEIILNTLGLNVDTYLIPVSFIIGATSLFTLNSIGNFARNNEDKDLGEIIDEIKEIKEKV